MDYVPDESAVSTELIEVLFAAAAVISRVNACRPVKMYGWASQHAGSLP